MTPGELTKVAKRIADLLARESNEDLTAEELSIEIASSAVEVYEEIQAKNYNLVVLGHFRLDDDTSYVAAVGPLSTRATQRARGVGERFAWDYRSRRGTGKFVLVPMIRDPAQAWDEARRDQAAEFTAVLNSITPGVEPSYEAMRLDLPDEVRARISADWRVDPEVLAAKFGPHCICGLAHLPERTNLGDPVTPGCPRHPKGDEHVSS